MAYHQQLRISLEIIVVVSRSAEQNVCNRLTGDGCLLPNALEDIGHTVVLSDIGRRLEIPVCACTL